MYSDEKRKLLIDTENATVLAAAAHLVSALSSNIISENISSGEDKDGNILTTETIEELALAEFQKRIITKGAL